MNKEEKKLFRKMENNENAVQQCISVMRAKVLNLNELNINKHIGKLKVKCS